MQHQPPDVRAPVRPERVRAPVRPEHTFPADPTRRAFGEHGRPRTPPVGVSIREGRLLVSWACFQLVVVAALFQAANAPAWSGVLTFILLIAFVLAQVAWSLLVTRARRVHPLGFNAMSRAAGMWSVLLVVIGGWFWIAQGPHATAIWVTTVTALIALAPSIALGIRLIICAKSRRDQ